MVKNLPALWETWVRSLGWKDPLEEGLQPTPVFLPREISVGYSPRGCKNGHDWATKHSTAHKSANVRWLFCFQWLFASVVSFDFQNNGLSNKTLTLPLDFWIANLGSAPNHRVIQTGDLTSPRISSLICSDNNCTLVVRLPWESHAGEVFGIEPNEEGVSRPLLPQRWWQSQLPVLGIGPAVLSLSSRGGRRFVPLCFPSQHEASHGWGTQQTAVGMSEVGRSVSFKSESCSLND